MTLYTSNSVSKFEIIVNSNVKIVFVQCTSWKVEQFNYKWALACVCFSLFLFLPRDAL